MCWLSFTEAETLRTVVERKAKLLEKVKSLHGEETSASERVGELRERVPQGQDGTKEDRKEEEKQ